MKKAKAEQRGGMWEKDQTAVRVCLNMLRLVEHNKDRYRQKTTWRLMVTFSLAEVTLPVFVHAGVCVHVVTDREGCIGCLKCFCAGVCFALSVSRDGCLNLKSLRDERGFC